MIKLKTNNFACFVSNLSAFYYPPTKKKQYFFLNNNVCDENDDDALLCFNCFEIVENSLEVSGVNVFQKFVYHFGFPFRFRCSDTMNSRLSIYPEKANHYADKYVFSFDSHFKALLVEKLV